jgi:hypothetical protein
MELDRFRESIEDAFADVPYPGDANITNCSYKQTLGFACFECVEIAEYFQGTIWRGHSVKDLRLNESALNFFTAEALHYYLPAFILAELEDPEAADVIYDRLISIFTPARTLPDGEIARRLSPRQREVMVEYFQDCLEKYGEYSDGDIARAIDSLSQ